MSRGTWDLIKQSKRFYIHTYRRSVNFLLMSLVINILFSVGIAYVYFNQPPPDYYATYGGTAPVELAPMDTPNESSVPLLQEDVEVVTTKVIPR